MHLDASGEALTDTDPDLAALMQRAAEVEHNPLLVPRMIVGGKYRIEAELGRGGMGAVYRATHIVSQKQVALKCMLRSKHDAVARARFEREARAAARIDHPNVVNVYDLGEEEDYCYLVMELLRGRTLRLRLADGPLTASEALELMVPVMRGVAAIHDAGVIHRDLKPENIFLCEGPDGVLREAKVLDFGVSALNDDSEDQTITCEGALLGTPLYMSPEQMQSAELDERSDIYALGVILYQMLTGKPPFDAKNAPRLVLDVVHTSPTPLRELRPELPLALERVVMRALAKRPEDRFATIEGMIAALLEGQAPRPTRSWRSGLVALVCTAVIVNCAQLAREMLDDTPASAVALPVRAALPEVVPSTVVEPLPAAAPEPPPSDTPPVKELPRARHAQRAKPDCAMRYSIDASGRKKYKPECLL